MLTNIPEYHNYYDEYLHLRQYAIDQYGRKETLWLAALYLDTESYTPSIETYKHVYYSMYSNWFEHWKSTLMPSLQFGWLKPQKTRVKVDSVLFNPVVNINNFKVYTTSYIDVVHRHYNKSDMPPYWAHIN